MEWLSKLFDLDKIPTRVLLLIWIVSFVFILSPKGILDNLSLANFKENYDEYIGIIFLSTTVLLFLLIINWLINKLKFFQAKKSQMKKISDDINILDQLEKALLREFFINGKKNTLKLPLKDPTVSGLIDKKILYQLNPNIENSIVGPLSNFSITDFSKKIITHDLLDIPSIGTVSKEEIDMIRRSRPNWIIKLEMRKDVS